ncbi:COP1-interactive protein 1 [Pyrus communis]|uniref:COP1-interactive protein 1 n=1 Tax=Pyrus communis TaxID=23211 RepID=UPI0035C11B93
MDLWVVAAAAGAGYLTKYWQNISKNGDKDGLLNLPFGDANLDKSESSRHPLHRLGHRKNVGDDVSTDRKKASNAYLLESSCGTEVASTSGYDGEKLGDLVKYKDCNVLSLSHMSPVYSGNENENGDGAWISHDIDDSTGATLPKSSSGERGSYHVHLKNKSSIRTKRSYGHVIKPVNSLESCLVAQLYKERAEEEHVLTLPSPSSPSMRPLFVTDGNRIISKASGGHFRSQIGIEENKLHKEANLETNENACGVPPEPKLGYLDLPKKMTIKTGKGRHGKLSSASKLVNGKHLHSEGSLDGAVLFCLGISIGIISSLIANKREVDKLKDLLKQTENLVQDLAEELQMKDSVTMKEIANENYGAQDTCDSSVFYKAPNSFSTEQNMDKYDGKNSYNWKAEESSESMSKIEAELEAELERLGLNMNTSVPERRSIDVAELDTDLMADFAQGELRADLVGGLSVAQSMSNEEASSTSTDYHCANYAVSPRELSLRLHEVIQSRLEERVQELEVSLQNSQRKVQLAELKHKDSWRDFSDNHIHSGIHEVTNSAENCKTTAEPLVMNLSGEALDAYNEAYKELMKISESDEEDSPCPIFETFSAQNHSQTQSEEVNGSVGNFAFSKEETAGENSPCQVFETFRHQSPSQTQSDELDGSVNHFDFSKEETVGDDLLSFMSKASISDEERISRVQRSNKSSVSGENSDDSDAEMEKQLIRQIVEKAKKGSPVVLNAQRWFRSIDENES